MTDEEAARALKAWPKRRRYRHYKGREPARKPTPGRKHWTKGRTKKRRIVRRGWLDVLLEAMEPGVWYSRIDLRELVKSAGMSYDYLKRYVVDARDKGLVEQARDPGVPEGGRWRPVGWKPKYRVRVGHEYLFRLTEKGAERRLIGREGEVQVGRPKGAQRAREVIQGCVRDCEPSHVVCSGW